MRSKSAALPFFKALVLKSDSCKSLSQMCQGYLGMIIGRSSVNWLTHFGMAARLDRSWDQQCQAGRFAARIEQLLLQRSDFAVPSQGGTRASAHGQRPFDNVSHPHGQAAPFWCHFILILQGNMPLPCRVCVQEALRCIVGTLAP